MIDIITIGVPALLISFTYSLTDNIKNPERIGWSVRRQSVLLGIIVAIMTAVGLSILLPSSSNVPLAFMCGFIAFLVGGLSKENRIEARTYPNQGVRSSGKSAAKFGIIFGVLGAIAGWIAGKLGDPSGHSVANWAAFGLVYGFIGGFLAGGGDTFAKHLLLRVFLVRRGFAPLNYARFLDTCAALGLLRKVGGGYIFVHRYLLEYFAELKA
jgi:hypothetical protein